MKRIGKMSQQAQQIRFGPAGIGGFKEAARNLEQFNKFGIRCAEIPFTYQVWLNNLQAAEIGKIAKKFNIALSIHAPYYINLNSEEKEKVQASMKRILLCCERAQYLQAKYVIFHAAYYQKDAKEKVYDVVKKRILEMQQVIKKNNWNVFLAPETTGKQSQFGSIQELLQLMQETKCFFCIDFAHMLARTGNLDYNGLFNLLKKEKIKKLHCHFSGIEYSDKGERRHIVTPSDKIKKLLIALKESGLDANIINESPEPLEDALKSLEIWKKIN